MADSSSLVPGAENSVAVVVEDCGLARWRGGSKLEDADPRAKRTAAAAVNVGAGAGERDQASRMV